MKKPERWKFIKGFEDRYKVSDHGRICSVNRIDRQGTVRRGLILAQVLIPLGYYYVYLYDLKIKRQKGCRVNRLVAETFIENPLNLPQVAHGDHDRSNNNLWNLKWSNQKDNTAEGIEAGRINANRPKTNRKVTPRLICEIALLHSQGKGIHEIAIMLDFPRTTISSVFNKRSNWELFEFAQKEIQNNP